MTKNIFFIFNVKVWLLLRWLLKNIVILLTLGKSKNIVILLTLGKSKNIIILLTLGRLPLFPTRQLCSPWLPTKGSHAMPGVTKCFPSSPYTSPFPTQLVRLPLFTYPTAALFPPDPTRPNPPNPTRPAPACPALSQVAE